MVKNYAFIIKGNQDVKNVVVANTANMINSKHFARNVMAVHFVNMVKGDIFVKNVMARVYAFMIRSNVTVLTVVVGCYAFTRNVVHDVEIAMDQNFVFIINVKFTALYVILILNIFAYLAVYFK